MIRNAKVKSDLIKIDGKTVLEVYTFNLSDKDNILYTLYVKSETGWLESSPFYSINEVNKSSLNWFPFLASSLRRGASIKKLERTIK